MVHARVNPAPALAAKCAAQHWAHYATAPPSASASPSVGSSSESPGAQWMLQAKRGREEVWYISCSSACPFVCACVVCVCVCVRVFVCGSGCGCVPV